MKRKNFTLSVLIITLLIIFVVGCKKEEKEQQPDPNPPTDPNPEDEADSVSIYTILSWKCTEPEGYSLTYDIYFGTETTPQQVTIGQMKTTYDPGTLETNTEYFWKIISHNNQSIVSEGKIWSFTTREFQCGDLFTDSRDGQAYKTIKIGDQCWMKENLAWLPSVSPPASSSEISPYYYVYGYGGTNISEATATSNYQIYGVLYNWSAALNACPDDWHLPEDDEWTILTDFLGGESIAGGKMKEAGTAHWNSPNTGSTNSSGFSALPCGYRSSNGTFYKVGDNGLWWSPSLYSSSNTWKRLLSYTNAQVYRYNSEKESGLSVRCVRD